MNFGGSRSCLSAYSTQQPAAVAQQALPSQQLAASQQSAPTMQHSASAAQQSLTAQQPDAALQQEASAEQQPVNWQLSPSQTQAPEQQPALEVAVASEVLLAIPIAARAATTASKAKIRDMVYPFLNLRNRSWRGDGTNRVPSRKRKKVALSVRERRARSNHAVVGQQARRRATGHFHLRQKFDSLRPVHANCCRYSKETALGRHILNSNARTSGTVRCVDLHGSSAVSQGVHLLLNSSNRRSQLEQKPVQKDLQRSRLPLE